MAPSSWGGRQVTMVPGTPENCSLPSPSSSLFPVVLWPAPNLPACSLRLSPKSGLCTCSTLSYRSYSSHKSCAVACILSLRHEPKCHLLREGSPDQPGQNKTPASSCRAPVTRHSRFLLAFFFFLIFFNCVGSWLKCGGFSLGVVSRLQSTRAQVPHSMWDLSSLISNQTHVPCIGTLEGRFFFF